MEYKVVNSKPLKLKTEGVKKKKKHKEEKKLLEQVTKASEVPQETQKPPQIQRTKAELAFLKQQEKMQKERIAQKASKTHKQRVEEFNRHLDSLTEHFDIPKVSWTK
ncbi:Protein FAM32A [Frankliniella fusca]|uniref:Protein FAM32A n=1 Tax=Frankliniella fusca TaxID=407009 RepID=A0AAE1GZR2_9NEOP|nr:Protein FAM32A [Frankliniella fusca]